MKGYKYGSRFILRLYGINHDRKKFYSAVPGFVATGPCVTTSGYLNQLFVDSSTLLFGAMTSVLPGICPNGRFSFCRSTTMNVIVQWVTSDPFTYLPKKLLSFLPSFRSNDFCPIRRLSECQIFLLSFNHNECNCTMCH
jgi:hypothetical protein